MRKILDLPERICACGCNRQFKPTRGNQRFFEAACRKKFHAEEMVAVRRGSITQWLSQLTVVMSACKPALEQYQINKDECGENEMSEAIDVLSEVVASLTKIRKSQFPNPPTS